MLKTEGLTLDFLRHGELISHQRAYIGQTDIALSDEGYQAMQVLVKNNDYTTIISSPLSRCTKFAKAFAATKQLPLQINENFSEINFGIFEGQKAGDILVSNHKNDLTNWWADINHTAPPNGESLNIFKQRVIKAFTNLLNEVNSQDKLLFVTHGGVIRCLIGYLLQIPDHRLFDFELNRASLTRFTLHNQCISQSRLIFLNKTNQNE